jgi:hypothetical protein
LRNNSLLTVAPTTSIRRICTPGKAFATRAAIPCCAILGLSLVLEAHQNLPRRAELLYPEVAVTERCECQAYHIGVERLRAAQFDQDAATKVDPEVQTGIEIEDDGDRAQERRDDQTREPAAHEGDGGAVGNEAQWAQRGLLSQKPARGMTTATRKTGRRPIHGLLQIPTR